MEPISSWQELAELISLALTAPAVILSCVVLYLFCSQAGKALFTQNKSAVQWFAMGIFIGFLGSVLDNVYWSIPWSLDYLNNDNASYFFQRGAYFNIFFRQIAGIAAGYCHIRCALSYNGNEVSEVERKRLHHGLVVSTLVGIGLVCILMQVKSWMM